MHSSKTGILVIALVLIAFFVFVAISNKTPWQAINYRNEEQTNRPQAPEDVPKVHSVNGRVIELGKDDFKCEVSQIIPDGKGGGELKKQTVTVKYNQNTKFEILDNDLKFKQRGGIFDVKPGIKVIVLSVDDPHASTTLTADSIKVIKP